MSNITITITPTEVGALLECLDFMTMNREDLMENEDDAKRWAPTFNGIDAIEKKLAMELAVKQFIEQYPEVSRTTIRKAVKDVLSARSRSLKARQ